MENIQTKNLDQEIISHGHLALIAFVALFLFSITVMKNPESFSNLKAYFSSSESLYTVKTPAHKYVAYEDSALANAPQVAGAEISQPMPGVINEDGTVTSQYVGEVLGAQTENSADVQSASAAVSPRGPSEVVVTNNSQDEVSAYIKDSAIAEQNYFGSYSFEQALQSKDLKTIQKEIQNIQSIIAALKNMRVPEVAVVVHQDKIENYLATINVLASVKSPENSQGILDSLQKFTQTSDKLQTDLSDLNKKFSIIPTTTQP